MNMRMKYCNPESIETQFSPSQPSFSNANSSKRLSISATKLGAASGT